MMTSHESVAFDIGVEEQIVKILQEALAGLT